MHPRRILIAIAPILIVGVVGYFVVLIQEWISDVRFYRRRTQKELDRIRRSLGKVTCVKHTLPTGEVEIFVFDKEKVGKVTGIVNEEEMVSEAERLIKEARDRTIN